MSRRESKVEAYDTLSSGDSNQQPSKQKNKEVNNNEVDELSKELSEMGCIVDSVKRPPNICVETCVYESENEEEEASQNEEDGYSDEFEEDKSEEEDTVETEVKSEANQAKSTEFKLDESSVKLTKSNPIVYPNKPASVSGRSGTSTGFGSTTHPRTRRINMSFTNERLREIERHNNILLGKILSARNTTKTSIPRNPPVKPPAPASVMRKNQQRKIDHDNLILLKKIQRAKSSSYSVRR